MQQLLAFAKELKGLVVLDFEDVCLICHDQKFDFSIDRLSTFFDNSPFRISKRLPKEPMDRLRALQIFSEVARHGSFVRASMLLSVSKATVTKHVAWLEESLGAQLLKRNSKQVALTEPGWRVLEGAREMLERYESIETEVRDSTRLPKGSIRIGTPPSFGAWHLMGVIALFTTRYPDIEVTVVHDDGRSDLVAEALDLSIRIAPELDDASYVAKRLMKSAQVLVASPKYFRTHQRPKAPNDLLKHNCLLHTIKSSASTWRFAGNPPIEVKVRGTIKANFGEPLKQAALLGHGISVHPNYMVSTEIERGDLEIVLPDYIPDEMDIYVVYSSRRNMPTRVRHLLEFLKEWGQSPPVWSAMPSDQKTQTKGGSRRSSV